MKHLENLIKNIARLQDDLQNLEHYNCPEELEKVLFEAERLNLVIESFRSTVQDFQNKMAETQRYVSEEMEEEKLLVPSQIETEIEIKTNDVKEKTNAIGIKEEKVEEESFWGDEDDEDFFTCEVTLSNGK